MDFKRPTQGTDFREVFHADRALRRDLVSKALYAGKNERRAGDAVDENQAG
jgi:hypothetical protein